MRGGIIKLSVYTLKSKFQDLLRPVLKRLVTWNISPNQITLFTCALCLIYAAFVASSTIFITELTSLLLIFLPVFMLVRMALNALDGMVASETKNQTALGSVLNEVCDVISDAALFSMFFLILTDYHVLWWLLTLLALLIECLSLAVFQAHNIRSQSGPFGKSDRAVYLGVFAIILSIFPESFVSSYWVLAYIVTGLVLASMTMWNRFKSLSE